MKRSTSKWWGSLGTLTLSATLVLTGCSSGETGTSADGKAKLSLEFWTATGTDQSKFTNIVKRYMKDVDPGVDIKVTYVPTTGIDEKVNVAIASNQFPDIYFDSSPRMVPLAINGVLAPLDSYITPEYNLDDYYKGMLDLSKYKDKLYMLPTSNSLQALVLNKALFKQAGAEDLLPDPETRSWTRDKFAKAVEKVGSLGNGVYGLGLGAVQMDHDKYTDGFIFSDGDEFANESYTKMTYNSDKNVKNFEWIINLTKTKGALPGAAGNNITNILGLFKQGKIGMMQYYGGREIEQVLRGVKDGTVKIPFDIMFARFPTDDGSPGKLYTYSTSYGIKQQQDKAKMDASAKFIMWLTDGKDKELNELSYVEDGALPARKSLKSFLTDPEKQKLMDMSDKTIRNVFLIPNYQQVRKTWFNNFQPAYSGQLTAKAALDNYVRDAQKLVDEGLAKQK
ncbi:ABC transporter substrate-binding protein [Paenibacillus piri]|uniref:Extracellular solute-binding protein n=1 Tax=Paenibacillus piri TaxID=2547395 RepID=A0A4R5KBK9_9BACL|nr:extracellular solute-binding protein [Paenibacillus piri]TDF92531.1 extracellular solute-binding protein [Paenibacillus piri]